MRLFRCLNCNHKMRLSGARCGKCLTRKPLWQRPLLWLWPLALILLGLAVVLSQL